MLKRNWVTISTIIAFAIVITFALVGLPYGKFTWVEAIANYAADSPPPDNPSEPGIPPINEVDPADNPPVFVEMGPVDPDNPVTVFAPELTDTQIGNPDVIARGVILSADFFALTPDGISTTARFPVPPKVCLRGTGVLVFLAADQMPRVPVDLELVPSSVPGYTCAFIERPGTVVLVEH